MQISISLDKRGSQSFSFLGKLKAAVIGRPNRLEGRDVEEDSLINEDGLTIFNLETLKKATRNFRDGRKLGEGGSGFAYKGTLEDGRKIAVKDFSLKYIQRKEEFLDEVKLVAKVQHENLVHILGYFLEGSELLLVYEFLPNKSLDKFLFDPLLSKELDWEMRFNIIVGIARGLVYLHDSRPQIIHRDIKASNILLDQRMNPKIVDFELARLFDEDETPFTTIGVRNGYLAPEYVLYGQSSAKANVYSFGVLLLEIICGRKITDFQLSPDLVWRSFERRHVVDVIDTKIADKWGEDERMRCIHVGLMCTQRDAYLRPSMSTVYSMLSNYAITNLSHPRKPPFVDITIPVSSSRASTSPSVSPPSVQKFIDDDWVSRDSETTSIKDTEEERQNTHKPLSLTATTNLTDDEIIEMKSYCSDIHMIGEGSFGKVYRGNFRGGAVAIKKIKHTSKESRTSLENEVRLLHGKEHKNLVALIAWCIEEQAFYLVYEYVKGCTLQEYLRENGVGSCLSWKQCLKIIQGIAEGIHFLHDNQIIHVDIKPENLMLDSADEIKIIDFGFSRHVNWEGTHRSTDRVTGTKGYWAPEYCLNHQLSYKHDVYSFGIVALEVLTGQRHVDKSRGSSLFHIPEYVKHMMAIDQFGEAVNQRVKHASWNKDDVKNAMAIAELALRCADKNKEKRLDMDFVVESLNMVAPTGQI